MTVSTYTPRAHMTSVATDVCARHGVSLTAVLDQNRFKEYAHARHEVVYNLREHGYRWVRIARFLRRDHKTIMNSYRRHKELSTPTMEATI